MAANCVTNLQKKLADYITALDKFNIPDSNLEMLLHKWLNLPENAELFRLGKLPFPSDEWLQEHLYAPASIVSEPRILEMYDKHLSEPIITDTIENANNIVRAVSKIISKDSVKILPTKDGKYLVVVTRPKLDNSAEIEKILANASRDEQGRLLAPNGKPSNLTERQYAQVRTKAFIEWFGDWINDPKNASKVVDENGEPMVVYHASNASFNTFKERDGIHFGTYATAIGLAEEKGIIMDATLPGEIDRLLQSNKLFLYSSFLNIRNITISEDIGTGWHTIIDKGFDGAQYDAVEGGESYVVFNPNQIKSATDNIGTFSREDDNVYHHKSNLQQAIRIVNQFEQEVVKAKTTEEQNRIVYRANQKLSLVLSPEIQVAGGYFGVRKDRTEKLKLLDTLVDLEKPASSQELGQLFTLLKNKFNRNFNLKFVSTSEIKNKRGNNVSCYIEQVGNEYFVYLNEYLYPSYTMLAEELLHPLIHEIQYKNPELFQEFLQECLKVKHGTIKVIVDNINRAYGNEDVSVKNNEIVTQVLAYKLKHIEQKQSSTFKQIIAKIVEWLNNKGLFTGKRLNFNLHTFAYCLKFENVKFDLTLQLEENGFNHITTYARTENDVFFEQQSELARLLNTIYGIDAVFTGAEYSQIVHDIIYKISDIITEVERNSEAALRYNSNILDTSVLKNADRKNIFALLGFDNILNFISSEYFHPANNTAIDGRKAIKQAKIIRDNIKAFIKSGMSLFAQLELFSLPSIDNFELVDTESNTTDPNVNEADDSVEFLQEMVGDSQEAWQRESRTEVAYDRASILVKQALTQCYKLNPDGTPITDKWGVKQRMDGREALQAIIKWTQGALTLSSMVKKLEAHATKEKWLQPIIDRLKDTSGKETAFLSQFFGVVSKYFQLYSIGKNTGKAGKKNYTVFEVNTHPALTEAKRSISGLYNAGVHPLFDSNGNVNYTSFELLKTISETLHKMLYSEDNTQQIAELLSDASMLLGYPVSVEGIQEILNADTFKQMTANSLLFIVKGVENNKNKGTWQPFSAKKEDDGIINNIGKFIEPITSRLEDVANTSFYDSGNMYQSYVIPSYLTKLILKMSLSTEEEYTEFIEKEYGKFAQFKDSKSQWRNSWLQLLQDIPDARHLFTHKVQLNFDGNKYMVSRGGARSMSDADLTLSIIAEYFKEEGANSTKRLAPAWFRVPLMSNKPSSEFIKFYSYRGPDYKNRVLNGCLHLFRQELSRMQTVKKRLEIFEKGSPELIQSFDGERGLKFCFFDFLNNVNNPRFKELVEKYTNNTITELEKGELSDLGKTLIQKGIEEEWQKQLTEWQNNGVVEAAGNIQNISKDNVEKALENFFWNDFLASNNILNLTITDLAYYKNTEDVQKRLAQLHAPGIRANIEATDFEGKKVSDGYTRTIYLKDLEIDGKTLKSNIIENVKVVFNRKLETLKDTPLYDAAKAAYKSIIESFEKGINVTDAQGYASPSSYRKKALLFGKWNTQAEEIYQKIISGEYAYTDIQTIFQPLKPFVYTQIEKDSDVDNVELPTIKMGVQNKNSEYLLIMAAAITQNEDTGMPNYLRAIYKVMEESHKDSVKGIDTVQFESTVKTGLTGVIDISEAATTEEAEELLRDSIYSNRDNREYDKTFVLELPFEDYCIQQEVPAHFRDHEQLQGSQIRMITVSDLNPNETYMVEGREVNAEEFRNEYEQTVASNILESINLLIEEFNLTPDATVKDRNIALAKVLQKEILSSPRYGIDLLMSCLLDENGKFMLPLGDPIQSKRIEQLINSIVKNRINKLKIAGGPIVQVSNFGTSRQLNIRFKGKNGETLKTLNDYISEGKTEQAWVEYIKENLAGIAYYEAFVPVYASEVFEDFMGALGNIDIEAVEAVNPDLLKMIGYRIPSEDKYSMAPIKVVGFMPKEAGDGIMLPYEITLITGSDYDIDKFYLMRKDIPLHKKDNKEIRRVLIDRFGKAKKDDINIFLDMLSNPTQKPVAKANYPDLWKEFVKIAYKAEHPTEGRLYRNNKIIDMTWEVLTHSDTADKILNPGGFEEQKLVGYLVQAARITGKSIKELEKLSTSQLKKICQTDKNIAFIGTHLQFYKQNAAASSILAIFAVAKVAHACLESNGFSVDLMEVCEIDLPYSIMGLTLYDNVELDPQKDIEGTFIGKTLGSLVASAADAVKDPVLNLMNINSDTVNMLNTLIRIGLPFRKAAKLLSTKVVSDLLTKYNTEKLKGFTTFNTILNDSIQEIIKNLNIKVSDVNLEDLTEEEVNNAILKNDNKVDYKILLALKRVGLINEAMSGLNFATRFNSISSAVGPLIIDNLKIEHTLAKHFGEFPGIFVNGHDAGFTDVFNLHPILEKFADSVDVARKLFGNHMPTYSYLFGHILECLKGYTLLDTLFRDRKLFSQFNDFYQSYLLVANNVVSGDASVLKYYIEDFPKEFAKHKTAYAGNPFIDAIRFDVDSESGNPVLKINTTGLDTEAKSKLTSGWLDLYKSGNEGKKLAFDLFQYCFYKGGIGFNPQTFMTLLPIQVKIQLKGYKETFEQLPTISASHLLDCFVRNNWHNDKVVPYRKFEKPLPLHDGGFTDFYGEDALKLQNILAFKTEINGKELFFVQTYFSLLNMTAIYKMATPLGNGGEFVEIPNIPTMAGKGQQITTITNREYNSLIEELEYEEVPVDTSTMTEQQVREMVDDVFGKTSTTDGITQKKQLMVKKLKEKGVKVDEDKVEDTAKKTC